MPIVLGIIVALLVIGSIIAIAWWNISARAAPYADESARSRARRERAAQEERENTVVIRDSARDGPGGP